MPPIILQSVVERVAEKLPQALTLPAEIVRAAEERYRLLETRVPAGGLAGNGGGGGGAIIDTPERRAAVVLEWAARQQQGHGPLLRLSFRELAAAARVGKPAQLEQLQQMVSNYLQPQPQQSANSTAKRPPLKSAATAASATNPGARSLRHRTHALNYRETTTVSSSAAPAAPLQAVRYAPQILPRLVICLAGHLTDPHGLRRRAEGLLQRIYRFYERPAAATALFLSVAERRGHLYDLHRYAAAYEAAALYHVVAAQQQPQSQSSSRKTKKNNSNSNSNSNNDDIMEEGGASIHTGKKSSNRNKKKKPKLGLAHDRALDDDDEDEDEAAMAAANDLQQQEMAARSSSNSLRSLQLEDLVQAGAGAFTYLEVKQVLPRVRELAKLIAEQQQPPMANHPLNKSKNSNNNGDAVDHQQDRTTFARQHPRRKTQKRPWQQQQLPSNESSATAHRHATAAVLAAGGLWSRTNPTANAVEAAAPLPLPEASPPPFAEWKAGVLRDAVSSQVTRDDVDGDAPPPSDDREALAVAAHRVLAKHGLLATT